VYHKIELSTTKKKRLIFTQYIAIIMRLGGETPQKVFRKWRDAHKPANVNI